MVEREEHMYRVWKLSEEDKKHPFRMDWIGDCYCYTVYENEEEKAEDEARIAKIHAESKRAYEEYIQSLNENCRTFPNLSANIKKFTDEDYSWEHPWTFIGNFEDSNGETFEIWENDSNELRWDSIEEEDDDYDC